MSVGSLQVITINWKLFVQFVIPVLKNCLPKKKSLKFLGGIFSGNPDHWSRLFTVYSLLTFNWETTVPILSYIHLFSTHTVLTHVLISRKIRMRCKKNIGGLSSYFIIFRSKIKFFLLHKLQDFNMVKFNCKYII